MKDNSDKYVLQWEYIPSMNGWCLSQYYFHSLRVYILLEHIDPDYHLKSM